MTLPLRIITRNFELVDEIDRYTSLQITRSWHGIGSLELRINRYMKGAESLQRGNIVFPIGQLNKAFEIRHREIELDESGKASENWVIHALPIKSWLGERLTIPPVGLAQDTITGDAESVMRHYVDTNAIFPLDINDKIPGLALNVNNNLGQTIEWQSRYKVLAEDIEEISLLTGLGWDIAMDYATRQFAFNVKEGRNLTVNQTILPPAIFSPEFGTLKGLAYTESDLNYKNFAVVAGAGEGNERRIVTVGDESAVGSNRRVLFVDARDIAEETDGDTPEPIPVEAIDERLRERGRQKLAEHQQEVYLEGSIMTPVRSFETVKNSSFITQFQPTESFSRKERKGGLIYERDYDLGDIVTLQNKDWGVTLDARITEVKEIYESGKRDVGVTFGNARPTLIDKIKQELSQTSAEIRR